MISEECEKCAFYDPCDKEVPCCFEDAIIKCSILKEYLDDYASLETKEKGELLIGKELNKIDNIELKKMLEEKLLKIDNGSRDFRI